MPAQVDFPYMVERAATPLSEPDLAAEFVRGHELARGKRPGARKLLETAVAIICVENANGRAIIQHNWGNIMANLAWWRGPFWLHPVPQEGQPLFFRAYATHDQGAAAWWRLMYRRQHRRALELAALGRPAEMVAALYASGYVFGGSKRGYRDAAVGWAEHYRRAGYFRELGPYAADVAGAVALGLGLIGTAAIGVRNGLAA